ncbi:hypothetical protein M2138_001749 [Dysgonomonadaceae bacterium PH5-43]|nr:hypothetical protein [Dysgonomonadaceae bacterium PH5-43]
MKKRNKGSNRAKRRAYAEAMANSRILRNLPPHRKSKKENMKKRTPTYKQMAFETAVRNPERYKGILTAIEPFIGEELNDNILLKVVSSLYLNGIVSSTDVEINEDSTIESISGEVIIVNSTRRADGGFPSGYQSRFWTYMRTLSELGFVYAQYNKPLLFSEIATMLISDKLDEQEAFSIQAMKYNRRSPYRNVSNDFNFFRFILEMLQEKGRLSYEQFIISTFSRKGNIPEFMKTIKEHTLASSEDVLEYVREEYNTNLKSQTILRDYPDVVLRLLIISGFISVQFRGNVMIFRNVANDGYINELLKISVSITEEEKADAYLYFQKLESYNKVFLNVISAYRDSLIQKDGFEYAKKASEIIEMYNLDENKLFESIRHIGSSHNVIPSFKYIAEPLKLEFYLSLILALKYGDEYAIRPNYKADYIGLPISHAPGNKGDIEVYSNNLYWLIEVTLIRNKTQQLNNETTSVIRHFKEDNNLNKYNTKYLSFVAPYVHEDTSEFYKYCIVMHKTKEQKFYLKPYQIAEFVEITSSKNNFSDMQNYTDSVLVEFRRNIES